MYIASCAAINSQSRCMARGDSTARSLKMANAKSEFTPLFISSIDDLIPFSVDYKVPAYIVKLKDIPTSDLQYLCHICNFYTEILDSNYEKYLMVSDSEHFVILHQRPKYFTTDYSSSSLLRSIHLKENELSHKAVYVFYRAADCACILSDFECRKKYLLLICTPISTAWMLPLCVDPNVQNNMTSVQIEESDEERRRRTPIKDFYKSAESSNTKMQRVKLERKPETDYFNKMVIPNDPGENTSPSLKRISFSKYINELMEQQPSMFKDEITDDIVKLREENATLWKELADEVGNFFEVGERKKIHRNASTLKLQNHLLFPLHQKLKIERDPTVTEEIIDLIFHLLAIADGAESVEDKLRRMKNTMLTTSLSMAISCS